MKTKSSFKERDMLRSFSLVFSRSVFKDIIDYKDFSRIDKIVAQYDIEKELLRTYGDIIKMMYRTIKKNYCCEYVFKNEFITKILIKKYGTSNTVAFNEFKIPPSIVDIALFNGESKAFEIKTEYDSPKRLRSQINNYKYFFDKCYLIIPEFLLGKYIDLIDYKVGILLLSQTKTSIKIHEYREAIKNDILDINLIMKLLHTNEYKNIIKIHYGEIPSVSCFEMYDSCLSLMNEIPKTSLRTLILNEIKKRKNNTSVLKNYPSELRQIALSLNLRDMELSSLKETLETPLI